MTPDELLQNLRGLELELRSAEVQSAVAALPPDQRTRFVTERQKLSASIGRLENAELSGILSRLNANEDSLKDGIASLRREIDSVERTVAIVNAVGTVAGFAARVAGLTG